MKQQALIFDIDDTLYDQLVPFAKAVASVYPSAYADVATLFQLHRSYSDVVFEASQKGELAMEDMHIFRIQHAFADRGYQVTRDQALTLQAAYQEEQAQIHLQPLMEAVIDYALTKKVSLGIISNGPADHQMKKVKQLGLERWIPKDQIIISGAVALMKPDPTIFQLAASRLGVEIGQCYYVGDHYDNDMKGIFEAGGQGIWLNHRSKAVPQGAPYAAFQLNDWSELLPLVAQLF